MSNVLWSNDRVKLVVSEEEVEETSCHLLILRDDIVVGKIDIALEQIEAVEVLESLFIN